MTLPRAAAARWATRLTFATGVVMLVSALLPALPRREHLLAEFLPVELSATANAAVAATGVLIVLLAGGLRRRKRAAWRAVLALCAAAVVLNVVKGLDVEESLLAGLLAVLLVVLRDEFRATPPSTRWWLPLVTVGAPVVGTGYGVAFLLLRRDHLRGTADLAWQAFCGLAGQSALRFTDTATQWQFETITGTFGLLTVVLAGWTALRSGRREPGLDPADESALRGLLDRYGSNDSLGYFTLRQDKSVMFSASGKSAIGYRVLNGVSLAAGDPIGDPEAWPGAIEAWLSEARAHGWAPAVLGCGERAGEIYARFGLGALELGDEAILDTTSFSLEGRTMRVVRQAVNRVERSGVTATVHRVGDLDAAEVAELIAAADAFRDGPVERGFSMALSRLGDPSDPDCVVVVARRDGQVQGLLHFVPWGPNGLSLDLMRRERESVNGMVEFLVVAAAREAAALGVDRISLNFAVFRSVFARGERIGAGPVLRVWRGLLLFASRFWQLESLYRANEKFRPRWEPRFLCYASARDVPRIAMAALRAEAFLVSPHVLLRGRAAVR
ncbi:phosphatidylglycerol lysyltransferase domain-containing protein [Cryptosporangium sp. NPDC051539]|uniref:phosphatidylglycerol lysyltransferase domain-containing protein n=1 Tax=Cryptosporangium sp. NPDC051539 TaxID=3363962 RepID=UPI0037AFD3B7